jgi:SH3-like domain-containing protein
MLRRALLLAILLSSPAWAATETTKPPPKTEAAKPGGHIVPKPATPKPTGHKPAAHPPPPAPKPAPPAAPAPQPAPALPAAPAEPAKGTNTGLPLPRFASFKTDDVNLRSGPGTRYPIEWVYKRRDLPVEIEREFEVWRLVEDSEGVKGWVHQATLTGRRSFVVTGGEQVMRAEANDKASPVARLKPGVVGRLRACDAKSDWCQVQVGDYRGWLRRNEFWGALPGEAVQ